MRKKDAGLIETVSAKKKKFETFTRGALCQGPIQPNEQILRGNLLRLCERRPAPAKAQPHQNKFGQVVNGLLDPKK